MPSVSEPATLEEAAAVLGGGERDLEAMRLLRAGFDPDGIANPGKVFPTPRLCGEIPGPYRAHPLERAGLADRL